MVLFLPRKITIVKWDFKVICLKEVENCYQKIEVISVIKIETVIWKINSISATKMIETTKPETLVGKQVLGVYNNYLESAILCREWEAREQKSRKFL